VAYPFTVVVVACPLTVVDVVVLVEVVVEDVVLDSVDDGGGVLELLVVDDAFELTDSVSESPFAVVDVNEGGVVESVSELDSVDDTVVVVELLVADDVDVITSAAVVEEAEDSVSRSAPGEVGEGEEEVVVEEPPSV
jgi:hypothetical protein